MSIPIPDDILILIVDELANSNNSPRERINRDLLNLISVSRDFWFPCRQRLYREVILRTSKSENVYSELLRFLKLLQPLRVQTTTTSPLAPFIKRCKIDIASSGAIPRGDLEGCLNTLAAILDLLHGQHHGVEELYMNFWLCWQRLNDPLQLSLSRILRSERLQSLTLEGLLAFPISLLRGTTFPMLTLDASTISAYRPDALEISSRELPPPELTFLRINFLVEIDPSFAPPPHPFFPRLQTLSMDFRSSRWAHNISNTIINQAPLAQTIIISGAGGIPRPCIKPLAPSSALSTRHHLNISWRISVQRTPSSIQRAISQDRILNLRDLLTYTGAQHTSPLRTLSLTLKTHLHGPIPCTPRDDGTLPPVNEAHWRLLDASLNGPQFPHLRLVEVRFTFLNHTELAGGVLQLEGALIDAVRTKLFPLTSKSTRVALKPVAYFE